MTAKRLMLLGAGGQIGQALRAEPLPPDWQLGAYKHADLDIGQHHLVQKAIREFKPDIIINVAAMTNVDACEKDQRLAYAINFESVANLAAQASAMDIPIIHLSTDYVFDGKEGEVPYKTDSLINPLNVYGDTKSLGEDALLHELPWHVILRVSAVFSAFGNNILTKLLTMIDEKDELRIVTDQKSCPTYAPDIAKAIITITTAILKGQPNSFGIFHYTGMPAINRFDFAQEVMNAYTPFTSRRPKITPVLSSDFPDAAIRPAYSALDCAKIKTVFGIEQKPWHDALNETMAQLMRERKENRMIRKGIILAGGTGTRLYPATRAVSKQLMPVHDKPMIYYPLSTLMLTGIRDILVISTPRDLPLFKDLLGDGSMWGINLSYAEQPAPEGLGQAFIIGRNFIGQDSVAMILGDNLYYGQGLPQLLMDTSRKHEGATIFGHHVANPEAYGVISFDANGEPLDIVEKPKKSISRWAVTGLYFYENSVVDIARDLKPSARNELEITDINRAYLQQKKLEVIRLGRGYAWFDTGTHNSLAHAGEFVRIIEARQGFKLGCPEETAYVLGHIDSTQVLKVADQMGDTGYAAYLREIVAVE